VIGRYFYTQKIRGEKLSNSDCVEIIQNAMLTGQLDFDLMTLTGNQRLDIIAGQVYGNSEFWWVIAAASGIGWGMQLQPGTLLKIPKNIEKVFSLL
jgi:hypothetical protein